MPGSGQYGVDVLRAATDKSQHGALRVRHGHPLRTR
jgi:hypothetical protein